MFTGCNNLTGEKGSTKATRHIYTDSRSAHIDGGYSNPGFFTDIANDQPSENAEPYYVIKGNTLTLYYDDQMDERAGAQPGWLHGVNTDENVVYAIITPTCRFYKPTTTSYMFYGYGKLERIMGLDYLDTSEVTDMYCMFNECSSLTSLDLSGFDTSKVTEMYCMFDDCYSLTSLDVSGFNTSKVTSMTYMFNHCHSLTSLDVSGFDTSKVTYMHHMFGYCSSLTSLDLSGFDTSKVEDMSQVFMGCSSLTSLDLSGFDTSKVTDMFAMFNNCNSLETIYGGNWNYIDNSVLMFAGCLNLVGGQGSRLIVDNLYDDGRSAHIDGGPSNPGLFTAREE
jgi:surface protein